MKRIISRTVAWLGSTRGKAAVVGLLCIAATVMFCATAVIATDLIDDKNAQQTGINVVAHDTEFRWLFYTTLYGAGVFMAVVAMLHELLRPANARISRVATWFGVVAAFVNAIGIIFLIGVGDLLREHRYKLAFVSYEYNALGDVGMNLFRNALVVTLFLAGLYGVFVGYLIWKSTYLPRKLGVIVGVSGSAWLIAFTPTVAAEIIEGVLVVIGTVGPLALGTWLLFKGVNAERWKAMTVAKEWDDDPPATPPSEVPAEPLEFKAQNITGRPQLLR